MKRRLSGPPNSDICLITKRNVSADGSTKVILPMKVKTSVRTTPAAIEYLLYSGIIFQTALVALTYKQIGRTARLFPGAFAYLVGAYFSILALAIVQLNRVHRERKRARLERERPAEQEKSGAP